MSSYVLPSVPGLQAELQRTTSWGVRVFTADSGVEQRTMRQSRPRYLYRLSYRWRTAAAYRELQTIAGFIARHGGPFDSFLVTDPDDYTLTDHAFGVGNGTATSFQLQRTMVPAASLPAEDSRSYWPLLGDGYEPVEDIAASPTPVIKKATVTQTETTHYTIGSGGVVSFVSAPGAGQVLACTLNYYRRVRLREEMSINRIVTLLYQGGLELQGVIGGNGVAGGPSALTYTLPFTLT